MPPIRWLNLRGSLLKNRVVKMTNTTRVITSCSTLSSRSEKGPPIPSNPMRLAGIMKQYSKKAIPQLMAIMPKRGRPSSPLTSRNFSCPYQANVMNALETISSSMV